MNEHLQRMFKMHDALKREERLVTRAMMLLAIVGVLALTLAAWGAWQ